MTSYNITSPRVSFFHVLVGVGFFVLRAYGFHDVWQGEEKGEIYTAPRCNTVQHCATGLRV